MSSFLSRLVVSTRLHCQTHFFLILEPYERDHAMVSGMHFSFQPSPQFADEVTIKAIYVPAASRYHKQVTFSICFPVCRFVLVQKYDSVAGFLMYISLKTHLYVCIREHFLTWHWSSVMCLFIARCARAKLRSAYFYFADTPVRHL